MKRTRNLFLLTLATGAILASCGPTSDDYKVTGPYMTGAAARREYRAFIGTPFATLNTAITSIGSDSQHIANFVDGLVENNEYGQLKLALAESAKKNDESTKFTFTIKGHTDPADRVPWLKWDGSEYFANENGVNTQQFVKADDFVYALQENLRFSNASSTSYITSMFVKGALEYNYYTQITNAISTKTSALGENWGTGSPTAARIATALNRSLRAEGIESDIIASDIPDIRDFKRVGVKALSEFVLEYELQQPADYFPTVLTYTAFLPINANFARQVGLTTNFGNNKESFLFNGPFLLDEHDATKMVYKKNTKYYDADSVHVDKVLYSVYQDNSVPSLLRELYEKGEIDGFGVTDTDASGWEKYVKGGKNGSGTIDNPAHDDTYSRYIESIDFNYHYMLNLNRNLSQFDNDTTRAYSPLTKAEAENFNKAVKLDSVRDVVLNSQDQQKYNKEKNGAYGSSRQTQTYSMKGFVSDSKNNRDYIEYLYDEYATVAGIERDDAVEYLAPGQDEVNGYTNFSQEDIAAKVDKAVADIELYNSTIANNESEKITLPVVFESSAGSYDLTGFLEDSLVNIDTNTRLNKGENPGTSANNFASARFFKSLIPSNDNITSSNVYLTVSDQAYYNMHVMGWAPDYGDPLTYLNNYTTNGEMAQFTNANDFVTEENPEGYAVGYHNENGVLVEDSYTDETGKITKGMLAKYDALVTKAKLEVSDSALRYRDFAKAEAHLLYELHLIRPIYNAGLGWAVTVSKAIGYERPTASYGLSSDKMKGTWVLRNTVGAAKRRELKIQYDTAKSKAVTVDIFSE